MRSRNVGIAFERGQRHAVLAQQLAAFGAGRKDALGENVVPIIKDGIQYLVAEVGHAHLVEVREGQRAMQAHGGRVLVDRAFLGADVVAGPGQQGEEFFHEGRGRLRGTPRPHRFRRGPGRNGGALRRKGDGLT